MCPLDLPWICFAVFISRVTDYSAQPNPTGDDHMIGLHGNTYKMCEPLKIAMPKGEEKMFILANCTITVDEEVKLHWLDNPRTNGLFRDENQGCKEVANDRFECKSVVNLNIRKLKSDTTKVICFSETQEDRRASDACVLLKANEEDLIEERRSTKLALIMAGGGVSIAVVSIIICVIVYVMKFRNKNEPPPEQNMFSWL